MVTIEGAVLFMLRPAAAVGRGVSDRLGRLTITVIDGALASPYADQAIRRVVESDAADRAFAVVVERFAPQLERLVDEALDSPAMERTVARVVESAVVQDAIGRIADDAIERLRTSEALWALIADVAQSPAVAEAIAHQGAGFADQVGDDIRDRSRTVDARLERAAWRILRRHSRPGGGPEPSAGGVT